MSNKKTPGDNQGMTMERFSEVIDKLLTDSHVQLLADSPEGTEEVTLTDNVGLGGTVQYFLGLRVLVAAVRNMAQIMKDVDAETFVDGLWRFLREDMIDAIKEVQTDAVD